ncbi:MAG: hypothetical protein PHT07_21920 [Paludibacter sp.]|nr:hypothetical protein [Paludibacter sp.]
MKKIILPILLICSLSSFSQGVVLRTGYSYSPEDGMIIFPPINLSLEYQFAYPYTSYLGVTTGGNIMISAWGGVGIYYGFKMKSFFIENKLNWFIIPGYEYYGIERTSQFSLNPKIGFEKNHMYIKAGPYIGINEKPENLLDFNYLHIGKVIIDVEAGFYLSVNEEKDRIRRKHSRQL